MCCVQLRKLIHFVLYSTDSKRVYWWFYVYSIGTYSIDRLFDHLEMLIIISKWISISTLKRVKINRPIHPPPFEKYGLLLLETYNRLANQQSLKKIKKFFCNINVGPHNIILSSFLGRSYDFLWNFSKFPDNLTWF